YANMWRITDDFWDKWELLYDMFDRAEKWCTHSGAGHWPDADMLPVGAILQDYGKDGWTKFTHDEQYTMLTLWCIMRAPLMIGGDMVYNDDFTLKLLTNSSVLEMLSQSRSARQLYRRTENGGERIVWSAFRRDGGRYIAVFNTSEKELEINVTLEECDIDVDIISLRELWSGEQIDNTDRIKAVVPPHGVKVYFADC
ncbi:MAG: alpha-galactosidase, partial [Ruminococcus sp.]|nr:alpha-galactosidase [Ruminococcus sp.]